MRAGETFLIAVGPDFQQIDLVGELVTGSFLVEKVEKRFSRNLTTGVPVYE